MGFYTQGVQADAGFKENGYLIASLEQAENSTSLHELQLSNDIKIAIIVGNEVMGVDQQLIDLSDVCIEIPQFGTKHSRMYPSV